MSAKADGPGARTLARLYCPALQRPVLDALLGIEKEARAGLERGLEHEVAHARLAWWREECARLARGQPSHPLACELRARFGSGAQGALAGLGGFVDTATWDLAGATFETRRELTAYCERWSAAFMAPFTHFALEAPARDFVQPFGRALRELELLNVLGSEARRGRIRLPLDELAAAHVRPEELASAHYGAALMQALQQRHHELRAALGAAIAALGAEGQPRLRALLVWAAIVAQQSHRQMRALPRATSSGDYHAPLDGWRAWRAARQADAGRFALRVN